MYPNSDKYVEYCSPLKTVYDVQEFNELTDNYFSNIKNSHITLRTKINSLLKINNIISTNKQKIEL